MNKLSLVTHLIREKTIDFFAITETWLTTDISDSCVTIEDFHPISLTDVVVAIRKHGVAIYINKKWAFLSLDTDCPNVHVVYLVPLDLYIVIVYRPPSYLQVDNFALINFVVRFCIRREIIVLGDFNLPAVNWSTDGSMFSDYDPLTMSFTSCFILAGLHQWVTFSHICFIR